MYGNITINDLIIQKMNAKERDRVMEPDGGDGFSGGGVSRVHGSVASLNAYLIRVENLS